MKRLMDIITLIMQYGPIVAVAVWAWYKFNKQHVLNKELQENKAELDKNIKQYEQCLQEVTEKQKYQNQRRLTAFGLYAAKKHERYIDLYERLCQARNQVLWRNNPLRLMLTFTDYNKEDMIEFLDKYNLTRARKEELLALWELNPHEGVRQIHDMMTDQEDFDTRKAVVEAVKAHLQADLYLPRMLSNKIDEYTTKLNDLTVLCYRETRKGISGDELSKMHEEKKELQSYINNNFSYILESMQKTLLDDSDVMEN